MQTGQTSEPRGASGSPGQPAPCLSRPQTGVPKFSLFSVYKLQREQLCDFVPLDSVFISPPLYEVTTTDGWEERKASADRDELLVTVRGAGRAEGQWAPAGG